MTEPPPDGAQNLFLCTEAELPHHPRGLEVVQMLPCIARQLDFFSDDYFSGIDLTGFAWEHGTIYFAELYFLGVDRRWER